jgi:hypothetical protein
MILRIVPIIAIKNPPNTINESNWLINAIKPPIADPLVFFEVLLEVLLEVLVEDGVVVIVFVLIIWLYAIVFLDLIFIFCVFA